MGRSKSSGRWLDEHFSDEYVKRARAAGYRSRAVFKLAEIDERDSLIQPGQRILDLGAAPGGWSQYAARRLAGQGCVIASDILPMDPVAGVVFIQGDFTGEEALQQIQTELDGQPVDLLLSDMAPNSSGMKVVDQPAAMYLAELALEMAGLSLRGGGALLVKVFQGEGFDNYLRALRATFENVAVRKPKASRARSPEVYLLARRFKNRT